MTEPCPIRDTAIAVVGNALALWFAGDVSTKTKSKEEVETTLRKFMTEDFHHDPCDGNEPWGHLKVHNGIDGHYYLLKGDDDAEYVREDVKMDGPSGEVGSNVVKLTFTCSMSSKRKEGVSMTLATTVHYTVNVEQGKMSGQVWSFPPGHYQEWKEKFESLY